MATRWRWRYQAEDLGGALDAGVALGLRRVLQHQRKGHVLGDRHVRVKRVVLEHHGDIALFGRDIVDDALADRDLAAGYAFQAGDHPEQSGFATARRPDERDEFAIDDVDVYAMQDFS
jgi:hypothetical protein